MNWGPIILQVFFVAYFILLVILATISFSNVNSNKSSESAADAVNYDKARTYLAWCVGIGWFIVGTAVILLIIAIIVGVVFSPEEAAAAAFGEGGALAFTGLESGEALELAKKGAGKLKDRYAAYQQVLDDERAAESGLLGYSHIFGSSVYKNGKMRFLVLIQKILLWITLIALFIFGVLAAIAASAIGQTSDKKGYTAAIWTAVLGIIPFSIILIWTIADWIYVSRKKKEIEQVKEVTTTAAPVAAPAPVVGISSGAAFIAAPVVPPYPYVAPAPVVAPVPVTATAPALATQSQAVATRAVAPPPPVHTSAPTKPPRTGRTPPPATHTPPAATTSRTSSALKSASNAKDKASAYYNQLTPEQKEQLKNTGSKLLSGALDYFSTPKA